MVSMTEWSSQNDAKSRLRRILGEEALQALDDSRVAVFGLGGVGSSCVEALVRGGIGAFILIDKDVIEPSNLNRQCIAFTSTIGRRKVDVMEEMVLQIDPSAEVTSLDAFVREDNLAELMEALPRPDYLVDAFDTLTAKIALARYAQETGIPFVSAMGSANKTDPTRLVFADLFDTRICPLCREMRKIARGRNVEGFTVLYSDEKPVDVRAQQGAERSEKTELGTLSFFPPIMGQMIAGYVIKDLADLA